MLVYRASLRIIGINEGDAVQLELFACADLGMDMQGPMPTN
jgi:hypothetical protein